MAVIDAIECKKRCHSRDEREQMKVFIETLNINLDHMTLESHYIYCKWQNEEEIEVEKMRN